MNPGGEPERDDTGLPPVDIEIPDDARDLDRDVQAYYRELRAQRRRQRRLRMHGSLARDGIVLPLLACCLILALVTGTLLTIFTATSDQNLVNVPGYGKATGTSRAHSGTSARSAGRNSPAPASSAPGRTSPGSRSSSASPSSPVPRSSSAAASADRISAIPSPDVVSTSSSLAGDLTVGGDLTLPLAAVSGSMLVLIPPACHCAATVRWLTGFGMSEHAPTYLVASTRAAVSETARLVAGLTAAAREYVAVALDGHGDLHALVPFTGLIVVLVSPVSVVSYARGLTAGESTVPLRNALTA